jgi:hypothetical protein
VAEKKSEIETCSVSKYAVCFKVVTEKKHSKLKAPQKPARAQVLAQDEIKCNLTKSHCYSV